MKTTTLDSKITKFSDTSVIGLGSSGDVYTIEQDGWYRASIRMNNNTTNGDSEGRLLINGNIIASTTASGRSATTYGVSEFLYLTAGTKITYKTVQRSYGNGNSDGRFVNLYPYHGIPTTSLLNTFIKPLFLKDLGQTTTGTIYGKHIDNTYYGGIMIEKSETATTGSITPGNFQGYITTNFNGEIIKIPYYL